MARSAYSHDAPSNLQSGRHGSTADQHLNTATINKDHIDFAPNQNASHPSQTANGSDRYHTDEQGRNTYQHKDAQGKVTEESMTNPDGSGIGRRYGNDGSRTDFNRDKDGNRAMQTYDKNGRLTETENRLATGETDRSRTDEQGRRFDSQTDSQGRLTYESMTNRDGSGSSKQYREDGTRTDSSWDKNGNTDSQTYDKDGRLSGAETRLANGQINRYRMDADATNYQHFDSKGRMTEESTTKVDGSGTLREYKEDGSRTQTNWDAQGNRTTTNYDEYGRRIRK